MARVAVSLLRLVMDIFLMLLCWLVIGILISFTNPFERGFFCDDESIRYPYKKDTVPSWLLTVLLTIITYSLIIAIEAFRVFKFEPRLYNKPTDPQHEIRGKPVHPLISNLYMYIGYYTIGSTLCVGMTYFGKYVIGRPRPHFYEICKPAVNCTPYTYVEKPDCHPDDATKLKEARLSFPSGHASSAAFAMTFMVLYIHARLVWPMVGLLPKHILQAICVVIGLGCGLSRISDYKHHWSDVLAGFVLGVILAYLTAVHMLGLFRQPHYIFSQPSYLALPSKDYSFGGDQFHSDEELKYVEHNLKERNSTTIEQPKSPSVKNSDTRL